MQLVSVTNHLKMTIIRKKVLSLQQKNDMDEKEFNKKLEEIYQEGYEAGEADMIKSLLEVIKVHGNDDPKQVLERILNTCTKKIV
jgi:Icc-related predicted phosphoesterase